MMNSKGRTWQYLSDARPALDPRGRQILGQQVEVAPVARVTVPNTP